MSINTEAKETIAEIINASHPISTRSLNAFMDLITFESIAAGNIFIKQHKPNRSEYFLLRGICRSFVPNANGDLITLSFFQDQTVITPHVIRTIDNQSNLSFETLTDCLIGVVNADVFLNLMVENLEIRTFANNILKDELIRKVNKEIGMASHTARERLIRLRKDHPNIENLIPHSMIASYLGITPISLSRIRKEISLD